MVICYSGPKLTTLLSKSGGQRSPAKSNILGTGQGWEVVGVGSSWHQVRVWDQLLRLWRWMGYEEFLVSWLGLSHPHSLPSSQAFLEGLLQGDLL